MSKVKRVPLTITPDILRSPWTDLGATPVILREVERVGLTRDALGNGLVVLVAIGPECERTFVGLPLRLAHRVARNLRWSPIAIDEIGL